MKWLLLPLLLLSSCAYVQTHRNLAELFREKPGYSLQVPIAQSTQQGKNYLRGHCETLRKHYPNIHDSVLLTSNNEIRWCSTEQGSECLLPISSGTATVLRQQDGYAYYNTLLDEIQSEIRKGHQPITVQQGKTLPAAHRIAGQVDGQQQDEQYIEDPTAPDVSLSFPEELLVQTDRVLIDWPLTLAYNVAIPMMAPFVFFSEFLSNE